MSQKPKPSAQPDKVAESLEVEAVANFCIEMAKKERIPLTHLKLQKLVYIMHGWHLAEFGKPLVNEEPQAWEYGPVFKSLYHALKIYSSDNIKQPIGLPRGDSFEFPEISKTKYRDSLEFLKEVWDAYKDATAGELVGATHREGTPWSDAYQAGERNTRISNESIKKYYSSL